MSRRLGAAGRSHAAQFDWQHLVAKHYLPLLVG